MRRLQAQGLRHQQFCIGSIQADCSGCSMSSTQHCQQSRAVTTVGTAFGLHCLVLGVLSHLAAEHTQQQSHCAWHTEHPAQQLSSEHSLCHKTRPLTLTSDRRLAPVLMRLYATPYTTITSADQRMRGAIIFQMSSELQQGMATVSQAPALGPRLPEGRASPVWVR